MVGFEGLGCCAALDKVEAGRLDLHEAEVVEVLPEHPDNLRSDQEDVPDFVVDDEIHVPHSVALLLVLESEVCLRQHVEIGRKKLNRIGDDGQLISLRAPRMPCHSDDISALDEAMNLLEGNLALVVLSVGEDLNPDAVSLEVVEPEIGSHGSLG